MTLEVTYNRTTHGTAEATHILEPSDVDEYKPKCGHNNVSFSGGEVGNASLDELKDSEEHNVCSKCEGLATEGGIPFDGGDEDDEEDDGAISFLDGYGDDDEEEEDDDSGGIESIVEENGGDPEQAKEEEEDDDDDDNEYSLDL